MRPSLHHRLALGSCLLAGLCAAGGAASPAGQPSFRIRGDAHAPLNADTGWAAALNEAADVQADRPFRLRIELERPVAPAAATGIVLQYRRNGDEDWIEAGAHDFPYPEAEEPRAPRLSIVGTTAFSHGEPASDLLPGSALPFAGGAGINLAAQAPAWYPSTGHHEFEFPLVIRRFSDGAVVNETGDHFELRLADGSGKPLPGQRPAAVTLTVPDGHVGGTFVETPGRIGPWQASNGDLYFVMEPAESDNLFMMVKSSDGGRSWREVDPGHRPQTRDLEAVDGRWSQGTLHLLHQVTPSVRYHAFHTSDHPTSPDTWAVRDEVAATDRSIAQAASLVVREDGTMAAFFVGSSLAYTLRDKAGVWAPQTTVEAGANHILAGPQAILGANGDVHFAYYREDGTLWHRRLLRDNSLSEAVLVSAQAGVGRAHFGAILPLAFLPATQDVVIVYRLADGHLWERRVGPSGELTAAVKVSGHPVVNHAVDSQQPAADLVAEGETLLVLYADRASGGIFSTSHRGGWQPPVLRLDGIEGSWVRGAILMSPDGTRSCGFIVDTGSRGGGGMNRFAAFPLDGQATR